MFVCVFFLWPDVVNNTPRQGTDNITAAFFAIYEVHFPVVVFWDLIHQSLHKVLLAPQMSGHWPVALELLLVFGPPYGPYAGQKFWRDLQSAAKILQTVDLDTSSHAVWLGDRIEEETGGRAPYTNVWDRKGVRQV